MREHLMIVRSGVTGRNIPDEYLETLHGDAELFRQIKKESDAADVRAVIEAVSGDIESKADAFKANVGNPFRVLVEAHTTHNGVPVDKLPVYYVQKGFLKDPKRVKKFDKPSTPTSRDFCPGSWVMWCTSPKGQTGPKQDVKVSRQAAGAQQKVELCCPE
jgi:hypothetical protein